MVSLLAMLGCSGGHGSKSATADSTTVVTTTTDSNEVVPTPSHPADVSARDPTEGRLRALRDSLAQLPNDHRAPNWFWEIGTLMLERFAVIEGSAADAEFARQHPEEFAWSQSDQAFFYTRYHFRELVRRFPKHERADDAAYVLADPVEGGECEGYVPCYIEHRKGFRYLNTFLRQFPESECSCGIANYCEHIEAVACGDATAAKPAPLSEALKLIPTDFRIQALTRRLDGENDPAKRPAIEAAIAHLVRKSGK